ncbi:ATP-binding protein [Streptomyces sp. CC210A]|uniref:sensor histidine kinase n=1 Tax=Streptomyces sp. CC210A TaxID=2898184 RepID=UPI0035A91F76
MRRHCENLLILSGHEHRHAHESPVPLVDVLRAAVSEIEHYGRVAIQSLPPHTFVAGDAADDLSHLLAELLENATAFSPEGARVQLSAWLLEDGDVMLSVRDKGVGIPSDRRSLLNARLAEPSAPGDAEDDGADGGLGLRVASLLAARHDVRVELREDEQGGATALVVLPRRLLPEAGPLAAPPAVAFADGAPLLTLPGTIAEANGNTLPARSRTAATEGQPTGGDGDGQSPRSPPARPPPPRPPPPRPPPPRPPPPRPPPPRPPPPRPPPGRTRSRSPLPRRRRGSIRTRARSRARTGSRSMVPTRARTAARTGTTRPSRQPTRPRTPRRTRSPSRTRRPHRTRRRPASRSRTPSRPSSRAAPPRSTPRRPPLRRRAPAVPPATVPSARPATPTAGARPPPSPESRPPLLPATSRRRTPPPRATRTAPRRGTAARHGASPPATVTTPSPPSTPSRPGTHRAHSRPGTGSTPRPSRTRTSPRPVRPTTPMRLMRPPSRCGCPPPPRRTSARASTPVPTGNASPARGCPSGRPGRWTH